MRKTGIEIKVAINSTTFFLCPSSITMSISSWPWIDVSDQTAIESSAQFCIILPALSINF